MITMARKSGTVKMLQPRDIINNRRSFARDSFTEWSMSNGQMTRIRSLRSSAIRCDLSFRTTKRN